MERSESTLWNFLDEQNELNWATRSSTGWEREGDVARPHLGCATWPLPTSLLGSRRFLLHPLHLDLKPSIKRAPNARLPPEGDRRGKPLPESPSVDSTPIRRVHQQHLHQHLQHISIIPYYNLLASMMCDAIYYFPMIYCVFVSLFE
jgi:hypothetical protein